VFETAFLLGAMLAEKNPRFKGHNTGAVVGPIGIRVIFGLIVNLVKKGP
jgi:hypothetical protein